MTNDPTRRAVLGAGGLAGLTALAGCSDGAATGTASSAFAPTTASITSTQALPTGVFRLGVASGDPLPDGVVIWTRLAPRPLEPLGGLGTRTVQVEWQVALDGAFTRVVASGTTTARPELAHSVHVEVQGLRPATTYAYRFRAGRQLSQVGRTRTLPARDARPARMRFAVASCQDWAAGHYSSQLGLAAEEDLALVLFLGDYVYEGAASPFTVRLHEGSGEPRTLTEYRARHAQYKTDPALRAAHAKHPWVVAMDDHEVDNNWQGPLPQDGQSLTSFRARRAAAVRAYYEHMPLRRLSLPSGPDTQLFRGLVYGDLVQLDVLDTRQYRTRTTMLGARQESWLTTRLRASRAQWNVVGSGVMVARQGKEAVPDDWDRFPASRQRLLQALAPVRNPVVVSGDRHLTFASDLVERFGDPGSRVLASEVTTTSLTSSGDQDPAQFHRALDPVAEPHWKYWDNRRGYVVCDLDRARFRAQLRATSFVTRPGGTMRTGASFEVADRVRGLQVTQR